MQSLQKNPMLHPNMFWFQLSFLFSSMQHLGTEIHLHWNFVGDPQPGQDLIKEADLILIRRFNPKSGGSQRFVCLEGNSPLPHSAVIPPTFTENKTLQRHHDCLSHTTKGSIRLKAAEMSGWCKDNSLLRCRSLQQQVLLHRRCVFLTFEARLQQDKVPKRFSFFQSKVLSSVCGVPPTGRARLSGSKFRVCIQTAW